MTGVGTEPVRGWPFVAREAVPFGSDDGSRPWLLLLDGRCAEALAAANAVLDAAGAGRPGLIRAAAGGTAAAGFLGRVGDAARIHRRGVALAAGLPWGAVELGYARCLAHLGSGDLGRAWADADPSRLPGLCLAGLAGVSGLAGDAAGARTWMAAADRRAGTPDRLFGPWVGLWRAWTASAAGETGEAVAAASAAVGLSGRADLPTIEAAARYDLARLGAPTDLRRLDALAGAVRTPLSAAMAGAARALSTVDGDGLARAGSAFGALGQHLLAAEAVTAAAGAYRRAGQRGTAAVYREKAAALRARCPLARTPLLAPDDATAVLTPREREVVLLAVRLSSQQIATRLGLSLHTVNNNLARSYAKLGVSGRAELRSLLAEARRPR
jgi:DNA-binding CsgD family transcriptional regulator